jgi:hypothetical protein
MQGTIDKVDSMTKYDHLPNIPRPSILQAPFNIPTLFAFNRTTVYLLMAESTVQRKVKSVLLRGTSAHGPLELEIPVTTLEEPSETIDQLAARKAMQELEEGTGWLYHARDENQRLMEDRHDGRFSDIVEKEAVCLGLRYQVGGKWCSFVAVEQAVDGGDTVKDEQIHVLFGGGDREAERISPRRLNVSPTRCPWEAQGEARFRFPSSRPAYCHERPPGPILPASFSSSNGFSSRIFHATE